MKKLIFQIIIFLIAICAFGPVRSSELPIIFISSKSAVHLRSPEPILYVDLPGSKLTGDLPLKNLLRIRTVEQPLPPGQEQVHTIGVITISGEHFLAQYRVVFLLEESKACTELEILPEHMVPLIPSRPSLSTPQMQSKSMQMIAMKSGKPIGSARNQGVNLELNRILSCSGYVFFDVSFSNNSALSYDIASLDFNVSDKKVTKASNFQSYNLQPLHVLSPLREFSRRARNVIVLPKTTFSAAKQLLITLSEKQPSSRTVTLKLDYGDVLSADSF